MYDKPTLTVVNQQQEVEMQESQLPEKQLRAQDSRPQLEAETQSLRKQQCEEEVPVDPTQACWVWLLNVVSENGQKSQTLPKKSVGQEPVLQRLIRPSHQPTCYGLDE
ncbi:hypothetical protein J437_LFUL017272 [Ladona fulva]|uniref:Uncharacterized protein n=1 Tax=Ladona fulva TaxID=123851 RepID=A0A8K0PBE2_LADFU|nr:hypothetical protein J437_LFUL017272 [Ladona fulva]